MSSVWSREQEHAERMQDARDALEAARLDFESLCETLQAHGGDVQEDRLTSLLFALDEVAS